MVRFNIAFFPALLYYMDKPWIVCGDILGWPAGGSRSQANRRNIMEKIAILRWESGHVPQGLMQLEQLPGNSTNPASYPFPVKLVEVKGANTDTVILHPSQKLLEDMIQLAKELEKEGSGYHHQLRLQRYLPGGTGQRREDPGVHLLSAAGALCTGSGGS